MENKGKLIITRDYSITTNEISQRAIFQVRNFLTTLKHSSLEPKFEVPLGRLLLFTSTLELWILRRPHYPPRSLNEQISIFHYNNNNFSIQFVSDNKRLIECGER